MYTKNYFKTLSLNTWFIISSIAIIFGYWFARHQVLAITTADYNTYPTNYFILTIFKCYLTIFVIFILNNLSVSALANKLTSEWLAITYLPLLFVFYLPIRWLVCATLLMQMLVLFIQLQKDNYVFIFKRYGFNCLVLFALFMMHFLTSGYSPLAWGDALLIAKGYNSQEIVSVAPLFKGYLAAKQFSFSFIDYSQWAGAMNPPITFNSPLLQFIAFIFDLPSLSVEHFYMTFNSIMFILIVGGSFGFYLFLRYAAKISLLFSFFGSCVFFFSGSSQIPELFLGDGGLLFPSYAVFPYAIMFISFAFERLNYRYAFWSGAALAAQFFLLAPHPEGVIYSAFAFALYTGCLMIFTTTLSWQDKIKLGLASLISFLVLSAFTIVPILYDRLNHLLFVFAHVGDVQRIPLQPFHMYFAIFLLSAPISFYFLNKSKRLSPVYKSALLMALMLCLFMFLLRSKKFIYMLIHILHIGLHFWGTSRVGSYLNFFVNIVAIYALEVVAIQITAWLIGKNVNPDVNELNQETI